MREAYDVARAAPGWWWRPTVILIVYSFIPVVQFLAPLGWWRRYYLALRAGEGPALPGFAALEDTRLGFWPVVNFFIWYIGLFGMVFGLGAVLFLFIGGGGALVAVIGALMDGSASEASDAVRTALGAAGLLSMLVLYVGMLVMSLLMLLYQLAGLDIACRCMNGDRWAALSPWRSMKAIMRRKWAALWLLFGHALAMSLVPWIGLLACVVGIYPMMILCLHAMLVSMVQWDLGREALAEV